MFKFLKKKKQEDQIAAPETEETQPKTDEPTQDQTQSTETDDNLQPELDKTQTTTAPQAPLTSSQENSHTSEEQTCP